MPIFIGILIFIAVIAVILAIVAFEAKGTEHWQDRSNERKGKTGERYVHEILTRELTSPETKIISNYMFQGQSMSVQVDHIVINKKGVFVIETKNWSGYIYGNTEDNKWTQVLAYGRKKHEHGNPVRQNRGHIYQLSKILPKGTVFHNLVVMAQGNTQNIIAEEVLSPHELGRAINSSELPDRLTSGQIDRIYDILMRRSVSGEVSEEQHVNEIKTMLADVDNNICPRCKGRLIIREGEHGKFYGCSNYPKCTFTKQL